MTDEETSISYLSADDIIAIHELIVESNSDTEPGVSSKGSIEYTVDRIQEGHFGQTPDSIHEKAFQLLRLLVANHPFVDGNKRTALMSTHIFYALNGYTFDYDRSVKEILKSIATDESAVDEAFVLRYLREHTKPPSPEFEVTINLLLERIGMADQDTTEGSSRPTDTNVDSEPNDYDDESHTEN